MNQEAIIIGGFGLLALFAASYARPDDTHDLHGTTVTLRPSDRAEAEIVFDNRSNNSQVDEYTFRLTDAGIGVEIAFHWQVNGKGDDAITVIPPAGMVCAPSCTAVVPEGGVDTIELYLLENVGL